MRKRSYPWPDSVGGQEGSQEVAGLLAVDRHDTPRRTQNGVRQKSSKRANKSSDEPEGCATSNMFEQAQGQGRQDSSAGFFEPLTSPDQPLPTAGEGQEQEQERLPNVPSSLSNKITACNACRKQKIRCDMPTHKPPCSRCSRRGLSCVVNKGLEVLVEDAKRSKLVRADVRNLHEKLMEICQKLDIEQPKPLLCPPDDASLADTEDDRSGGSEQQNTCEVSPPQSPSAVQAPIDTFLDIAKLGSPGSLRVSQSAARAQRSTARQDLIDKGIITLPVAERLVNRYMSQLDHYIYGLGSCFGHLQALRSVSPVALAAICTVSALHDPQDQTIFEACNKEFRQLISASLFEKRDKHYIRALCIGSFWLADASRILLSDAIRRAADTRLHCKLERTTRQVALRNDERSAPTQQQQQEQTRSTVEEDMQRARLWYMLFIGDQHSSVLHNRDALLRTDTDVPFCWEQFLQREDATDSDVRMLSQVALLLIMGQIRDLSRSEQELRIPGALANQLANFSRQLDRWFARFSVVFKPNPNIGDFPIKGLQLHYHFGKLYLGQQVFKGLRSECIPAPFMSAAHMAHAASTAIFDMILDDKHLQESLLGMPHYFHIMIAFAIRFSLEVCKGYHHQLCINPETEFGRIRKLLGTLEETRCIPQHPIGRMTAGISRMLGDYEAATDSQKAQGSESMGGLGGQITSETSPLQAYPNDFFPSFELMDGVFVGDTPGLDLSNLFPNAL